MTLRIRQFLDDLAADRTAEWELVNDGEIRAGKGEGPEEWHCPLSWRAKTKPCHVSAAATVLGLSIKSAEAIADAADNCTKDLYLRQQLLAACRLPEMA